MARAIDVARYLLELAASEIEPEPITHLRLQKLLYYVQGWSLATRNKPAFQDTIVAWVNGPVVRSVYNVYQQYGDSKIPFGETADIDPETASIVEYVWNGYRTYSAAALYEMTHQELPWIEARHGAAPDQRTNTPIKIETMRAFFEEEFNRHALPGMGLEAMRIAKAQSDRGEGLTREQVLERMAI